MSLYQTSVLKSYINLQEDAVIEKAYKKYVKYFLNPTIQENIRSSKEEEYQGIFLTELFVNILDYTLKPKANFNLVAEYKNQTNSRKADGAILHSDIALGVIELKGTKTKDLESIRKQAFDYKANQKGCVYVITSNFEKLRFYINDATEFEEFNLFELTKERFQLFYLCLQKDNIINNVPLKIKEASIVQEEKITKDFYKDYSLFKRELYRDLVKQNAKRLKTESSLQNEKSLRDEKSLRGTKQSQEQTEQQKTLQQLEKNLKLTLFKKSQKLIDRFLFIFFAEDRSLLPANSTQQILDKWKDDLDFGDDRPLYTLFKQYFKFLDQGRAGTTKRAEIYAYNGGLFKEDTLLDGLEIDSDLLYKHTHKLAGYDFESQVDVNILGHIFENSLNEIESVNAEIEGADFDKQKSKRKKDGVFYTPKYITKYIVENTVGKLCKEKKAELGIKEEEYFKGRKNRNKTTITKLVGLLDQYRDWLLQLTICDPACGSGAFLNQALNFLITEHTYIDELKTKVLGGGLQFPDIENTILENNIFGVDLNEESVEIAKLSLWLRTAQPRRKLNDLSSNIKCGNSLIDGKTVAGDKAFHWETQFPKVFEKGGFDVVIGNPPYTYRNAISEEEKLYFKKNYLSIEGNFDLYKLFIEKTNSITKNKGFTSFIVPNTFLSAKTYKKLRKIILDNFNMLEIFDLGLDIFENVVVESVVYTFKKEIVTKQPKVKIKIQRDRKKNFEDLEFEYFVDIDKYSGRDFTFNINISDNYSSIIDKMQINSIQLETICYCTVGINTGYIKDELTSNKKINLNYHKMLNGKDISRYGVNWNGEYIMYDVDFVKSKGKRGRALPPEYIFEKEKILVQRTRRGMKRKLVCYLDSNMYYNLNRLSNIVLKDDSFSLKAIYPLLNSKLLDFYFNVYFNEYEVKPLHLGRLPITKKIIHSNKLLILGDNIHTFNLNFIDFSNKLQTYLKQKFQLEKLSKKLQNWYELDFGDFIKELNKAIKANNRLRAKEDLEAIPTLTKKDEFEWLDLFEENKQKAQALQTQINQTDKEIDAMVYELYGLTDEEIAIVENS